MQKQVYIIIIIFIVTRASFRAAYTCAGLPVHPPDIKGKSGRQSQLAQDNVSGLRSEIGKDRRGTAYVDSRRADAPVKPITSLS